MKEQTFVKVLCTILVCALIGTGAWLWKEYHSKDEFETQLGAETKVSEICYENSLIISCKDGMLLFLAENRFFEYPVEGSEPIQDTLADIWVKDDKVWKISLKSDTVKGRILALGDTFIEIEGYGRITLSSEFHIYELYDEPRQVGKERILVGYEGQEFIVGNKEVCGALLKEQLPLETIRVLLLGNNYQGMYHAQISLTSTSTFTIMIGTQEHVYEAGASVTLSPEVLQNERAYVTTANEEDKITISSLERSQGNPSYYGSLEIWSEGEGLLCVNEVLLEQYLYTVVPSEMPASYGVEALKAQAVCARSYAYRNMLASTLSEYGAHVDDSSGYQVYNNQAEYPASTQAVQETTGLIMKKDGEIVEAYYFSTSSGHTTNADIWGEGVQISYINGKEVVEGGQCLDFSDESVFASFIKNKKETAFDSSFPWYRWEITFSMADLQNLAERKGLTMLGTITGMTVTRRGTGGVAKELTITGTEGTAVIEKELEIRNFLLPSGLSLVRNDGQTVTDFALLPSAYFTADPIMEGDVIIGYQLYGGGFGHGAGMSQNAVKAMVEQGYSYQDALLFFYDGVTFQNIVEE